MHYCPPRPSSRKSVVTGTVPTPEDFRASTTGIGSSYAASLATGATRAQRVANSCDTQCAQMLPRSYPRPMEGVPSAGRLSPQGEPLPAQPAQVATTYPTR